MSSKDCDSYFAVIKHKCCSVIEQQNKTSVEELQQFLATLPSLVLFDYRQFILFPLRQLLLCENQTGVGSNSDLVIAILNCIDFILHKVTFLEWDVFEDIVHVISRCITKINSDGFDVVGSEDVTFATVKALRTLFNQSSKNLWRKLFCLKNIPLLGQIVTLSLTVTNKEKSKRLVEAGYQLLISLYNPVYMSSLDDNDLMELSIGEVFAGFVPGIATAVFRTISVNPKTGISTKRVALKSFYELLQKTVSDRSVLLKNSEDLRRSFNSQSESNIRKLHQDRDHKWLDSMGTNLNLIFSHFIVLANSDNSQLRKCVLDVSINLLKSCFSSLEASTAVLLQVPISLLHDEYGNIRQQSNEFIEQYTSDLEVKVTSSSARILNATDELLTKLPKVLLRAGDTEKIRVLNLLAGYLQVLGPKLDLLPDVFCTNLVKALLPWFELDLSGLHVIEDTNILAIDYEGSTPEYRVFMKHWLFEKSFLNHNSSAITKALIRICYLLGKNGNVMNLFELLLEKYEHQQTCCQTVIIMNEILRGIKDSQSSSVDHLEMIVTDLMEVYFKADNWNLVCSANNTLQLSDNTFSLKSLKTNITLMCLHLEAVSTMAHTMGASFQTKLIVALYPILEKVLNSHNLVSTCAVKTLKSFAESCGYISVADLINQNADYLISNISIQLLQITDFPQSPAVLQAMLLNSDVGTFTYISDTIEEIITAMDEHWDDADLLLKFLELLLTVTQCIKRWFVPNILAVESNPTQSSAPSSGQDVVKNVLKLHEDLLASMNFDDDDDDDKDAACVENVDSGYDEADNPPVTEDTDETPVVPDHINVILVILNRCSNLISCRSPRVRRRVLDIIFEGVTVLATHEDSFLPFVHKIWDPLVERLSDEMPIVIRSFELVHNLSILAKDFVCKRFMKKVYPKLLYYIDAQPKTVVGPSTICLRQSLSFKLLKQLLTVLGKILVECSVPLKQYREVCYKCLPFLSSDRPKEIQSAAVEFFKDLIKINPDFLWITLQSVRSPGQVFKADNPAFLSLDFTTSLASNETYAKNVNSLLQFC